VSKSSIQDLNNRLKSQKGIDVDFSEIKNSNHFFKDREEDLKKVIDKYIQKKTELI
jgi:alpha/beta superfamily hydrolase